MEEELMFKIRDDLLQLDKIGFNITDIKIYQDLEFNTVISYKYGGRKFVITNDIVGEEE